MFYRIISALGALGLAINIVEVAPSAWVANPFAAAFVIATAALTALRWVGQAIEGEKAE